MVSRSMNFPPSRKDISPIDKADWSDEHEFVAANDPEHPLPLPEPIPAVELDPEKLPTWQRAFILGPNVRFTRTPGRSPAKPEVEIAIAELQEEQAVSLPPAHPSHTATAPTVGAQPPHNHS